MYSTSRIYPIRYTSDIWLLRLYSKHVCDISCKMDITYDNETNMITYEYKDIVCGLKDNVSLDDVILSEYDISRPYGTNGKLVYMDRIVIKDLEYKVCIDFPVTNFTVINIKRASPTTLRELLYIIKNVYMEIYKLEEHTATRKIYPVIDVCGCVSKDLTDFIVDSGTIADRCSICFNDLIESCKLNCNHTFHRDCINSWIGQGQGTTCPLCRKNIRECNVCNGSGEISYDYECVVVPDSMRVDGYRNNTDGIFNIDRYDFEDLILKYIVYNNKTKQVHLSLMTDS